MITITEREKAYMIAKAKHEARQALFRELEQTCNNRSYMIDRILYSNEAYKIFDQAHGERFDNIFEKRKRLRAKSMESWKAGNRLFLRRIEEHKIWIDTQKIEGIF